MKTPTDFPLLSLESYFYTALQMNWIRDASATAASRWGGWSEGLCELLQRHVVAVVFLSCPWHFYPPKLQAPAM